MRDKTSWKIEDYEGFEHIITFDASSSNRNIYIDNELKYTIPNTLQYSKFFNYEYRFEAFGKSCRIHYIVLPLAGTENPTLVIDGLILKSNDKYSSSIPPMPIYGWISIVISLVIFLATVVCGCIVAARYDSITYAFTIPTPAILSFMLIRFLSNMPLKESFSNKQSAIIRISFILFVFSAMVVFYYLLF